MGAAIITFIAHATSAVLGYVRVATTANYYGTSSLMDVFIIAFTIPEFITVVIYSCLPTAIIPSLKNNKSDNDQNESELFWSGLINISIILIFLCCIIYLLRENILLWLAPNFSEDQLAIGKKLSGILVLFIFFRGMEFYFRGWLFEKKHFITPVTMGFIANISIIITIFLFYERFDIEALAYGWLFSSILLFTCNGLMSFKLIRPTFKVVIRNPWIRVLFKSVLMIAIIESVSLAYPVIDRYLAGHHLKSGYISALRYAFILVLLPNRLFSIALSTVSFPFITDLFKTGNINKVRKLYSESIYILFFIMGLAGVGIAIFADDIIVITFQRGAYDLHSLTLTKGPLIIYSLGLVFNSMLIYQMRFYYARSVYFKLGVVKFIMLIVKLLLSIGLVVHYKLYGLAFATSFVWVLGFIIISIDLGKTLRVSLRELFAPVIYKTVINILIVTIFWIASNSLYPDVSSKLSLMLKLGILGGFGLALYWRLAVIAKLPQITKIREVFDRYRSRFMVS